MPSVRQGLKSSFPRIYNNMTVIFSFLLEYKVLPGYPGSCEQGERQRTESLGSWHWHWHRSLVHDGSYCRCWLLLCYWGKPYCLGMCSVSYRGRSLGPWVFLVCWQTHASTWPTSPHIDMSQTGFLFPGAFVLLWNSDSQTWPSASLRSSKK